MEVGGRIARASAHHCRMTRCVCWGKIESRTERDPRDVALARQDAGCCALTLPISIQQRSTSSRYQVAINAICILSLARLSSVRTTTPAEDYVRCHLMSRHSTALAEHETMQDAVDTGGARR
ncbi:unnamed protein product [Cercospora beticola]|nr:unnamed protein product [Cercospora beticola]